MANTVIKAEPMVFEDHHPLLPQEFVDVNSIEVKSHEAYYFEGLKSECDELTNPLADDSSGSPIKQESIKEEEIHIDDNQSKKGSTSKQKLNRLMWDCNNMQKAIDAAKNGLCVTAAAARYNVPRNTLRRRVLYKNVRVSNNEKVQGRYTVFSPKQEQELVNHLVYLETRFFGITTLDLRRAAFELAESYNLPHIFNKKARMAGKAWVTGFRSRNPELRFQSIKSTSAARATCFNEVSVARFFQILTQERAKHKYPSHQIFSVEKAVLTTAQSDKVLSFSCRQEDGFKKSSEKGVLSSIIMCMSAAGHYLPPFLIFPRESLEAELVNGAPRGSAFTCHPSGLVQTEIFVDWLQHFFNYVQPSVDNPVLLILDGHSSHARSLEFVRLAEENHTVLVCLPPYCAHKMQPLNVYFMRSLKKYYIKAAKIFLKNNPGREVTQYQVSSFLGQAYRMAAAPLNAVRGFEKCGIEPLDVNIFADDFPPK